MACVLKRVKREPPVSALSGGQCVFRLAWFWHGVAGALTHVNRYTTVVSVTSWAHRGAWCLLPLLRY